MYWKNLARTGMLYILLALGIGQAMGQYKLNDTLPFDASIKKGKLPNGLTYYIKTNKKPEQKVELRLVVNAGSINEDPDQLGLAHMTEHMAFNGTKRFKKNDIISFLQNIGVGFGNDLNAYTSFNETVYILPIPTDKPGNLEKGFQVLEDWANNVTLLDGDIDGERPIILEESRLGKGAYDRMMLKQVFPRMYKGSLYGERLPIGKDSIIKGFKYDVIRRFYRDWYRPGLMAVVVVGDIETAQAEAMIRKHFSGLKDPSKPRERKLAEVGSYASSDAMVVTDKEATNYQVLINYPFKAEKPQTTVKDYRDMLVKNLFTTMLSKRLQELVQRENPPFVFGFASFDSDARGYEAFQVDVRSGTSDPKRALEAAAQEVERARRYGFLATELERAKKDLYAQYERSYNDRDKRESGFLVGEYVRNYLEAEPVPGLDVEFNILKQFLPSITIEEVNAVAAESIKSDQQLFTAILGPEPKGDLKLPTGNDLLTSLAAVSKLDLKPYEEKAVAANLLEAPPVAGKILNMTTDAKLGTVELNLSNGVTVTLKPTDFKNDQILMSAIRPGGMSNYALPDKYNANYATAVVNAMGYGSFAPLDLQKTLSGKPVAVQALLTETTDGFTGNSTVNDLETMFQLLYLKATKPRYDSSLFRAYIQRNKSQVAMLGSNPQTAFIDTMFAVYYKSDPNRGVFVPKAEYFDSVNAARAMSIYNERFGDASGMHFIFVGSFKNDKILPLIETYIASLPATGKKFTYVDKKVRPLEGNQKLNVYKGKEEKSLILSFYSGEIPYDEELDFKSQFLTEVLNIRIIEELREKVQGIYGGGIFGGLEKTPFSGYQFVVQLPCGPEKVDTLLRAMNKEIDEVIIKGPSQSTLDKVKKQLIEASREQVKQNETWVTRLRSKQEKGENLDRFIQYEKYINAVTVKDVQDAAKKTLGARNRFTAVLMPESYANKQPASAMVTGDAVSKRKNNILQSYEIEQAGMLVELYDNAEVDGDEVTLYFNGRPVVSKRRLSDKPISVQLTAEKGRDNDLVMFAENLGTIPPNTAYMKVTVGSKTYSATLQSDLNTNGTIRFRLK